MGWVLNSRSGSVRAIHLMKHNCQSLSLNFGKSRFLNQTCKCNFKTLNSAVVANGENNSTGNFLTRRFSDLLVSRAGAATFALTTFALTMVVLVSNGSTVVDHTHHHLMVNGSSQATIARTEREDMAKIMPVITMLVLIITKMTPVLNNSCSREPLF